MPVARPIRCRGFRCRPLEYPSAVRPGSGHGPGAFPAAPLLSVPTCLASDQLWVGLLCKPPCCPSGAAVGMEIAAQLPRDLEYLFQQRRPKVLFSCPVPKTCVICLPGLPLTQGFKNGFREMALAAVLRASHISSSTRSSPPPALRHERRPFPVSHSAVLTSAQQSSREGA